MKNFLLISTLFAAAAGTLFADENPVPENNENTVPAAEIAENDVPANTENAAGTQNSADENSAAETDEAALEIVARESADDAGTDEIDESQTAKLIDEALEKSSDENTAATSGNAAADSAGISTSAGTSFTIFGHTFRVNPKKSHAPLTSPLDLAPAIDKRVRIVLPAEEKSTAKKAETKTDDADQTLANAAAGTAISATTGTASTTTLAGTNSGIATRSFFSTASTSSASAGTLTGTAIYSASTAAVTNLTPIADTTNPYLVPTTDSVISVDANDTKNASEFTTALATTQTTVKISNIAGTDIDAYTAIIKDGAGTLKITENLTLNNSFVVREGTVEMKSLDSTALTLTIDSSKLVTSAPTITVSGKNATLIFDNTTYSMATNAGNYQGCVVVGGQDGDGTLILRNGSSVSTTQAIWAGTVSWADYTYGTNTYLYYTEDKGGTKQHVLGTVKSASDSTPYRDASNFADADGNAALIAMSKATIEVYDSTLSAGTVFYVGNADIVVSGTTSKISDNARSLTVTTNGTTYINSFGSTLGTYGFVDATTTLTIEKGATAEFSHVVTLSSLYYGGNTTVTVDGTGSVFKSTNVVWAGVCGNSTTTASSLSGAVEINLQNGGKAEIYIFQIGGKIGSDATAKLTIDSSSSFEGASFSIYHNGVVENAGTMTINSGSGNLYVNGVLITEAGSKIAGTVKVDNSSSYGVGTLEVKTGTANITTVSFATGTTLLLANDLISDLSLAVGETTTLDIIASDSITFGSTKIAASDDLTDTVSPYAQYDSAFDDYTKTWSYANNILSLTLTYIPEPSMFGLFAGTLALALAGTRRRRKL